MGLSSRLLRLPRPQTFLYSMSLSTGVSLITLSLLLNKLSGFYGILALLTGFHLSPFQLSMYIYSILALLLTVYLFPHVKTQSPLHCMGLAWFYVLDSIVNAAYTAMFAMTWFLVLAQHGNGETPNKGPGAGMIDDTAGFTDPKVNVSRVDVGQDAVATGVPASVPAGSNVTAGSLVLGTESINSIGVIVALWTIRLYFCVVMLAWARMVLRQYIAVTSVRRGEYSNAAAGQMGMAEDPFAEGKPEGQGWKGKLGRAMVGLGRNYWLGSDEDESWMMNMGNKFHRSGDVSNSTGVNPAGIVLGKIENGPTERERRRRSGTGPPLPSVQAKAGKEDVESGGLLKVPSPNL